MDDLKPCPMCGGKGSAKKTYESDWWQVVFSHENDCPLGKVSNPYKSAYSTESEAIAAWNRRVQLSAQSVSAVQPVADAEIIAAAKNLVAVKGRHHSEQAYKRLVAAIAAQSTEGAKG